MFKLKHIFLIFIFGLSNLYSMDSFSGKREMLEEEQPEKFFKIKWKNFDQKLIPDLVEKIKEVVDYEEIEKSKPDLSKIIDVVYKKLLEDYENYEKYINNKNINNDKYKQFYIKLFSQLQAFINVLKTNSEKNSIYKNIFGEKINVTLKKDAKDLMVKIKEVYEEYGLLKKKD